MPPSESLLTALTIPFFLTGIGFWQKTHHLLLVFQVILAITHYLLLLWRIHQFLEEHLSLEKIQYLKILLTLISLISGLLSSLWLFVEAESFGHYQSFISSTNIFFNASFVAYRMDCWNPTNGKQHVIQFYPNYWRTSGKGLLRHHKKNSCHRLEISKK